MKHASLFSGIGGFDLAAQWMGWENVFQVEIDDFCQKVLAKNFPNVTRYGDIKQFDGTKYTGTIDILTGGFPCQPFSVAGKRKGEEDDRHLWVEMLRAIDEIKPHWIVGENVPGIISMALHQVLTSLEDRGYTTETYIIPACAVNAPHRRERVWIVAYNDSPEQGKKRSDIKEMCRVPEAQRWTEHSTAILGGDVVTDAANTYKAGLEERQFKLDEQERSPIIGSDYRWGGWTTESALVRGVHGIPNRVDRIKSLGNAIVPQVAFEIFKAIDYLRYK